MAVLTDPQRITLHAEIMSALSANREPMPILKAAVRAAVDAADDWANSNAGSYNTALPAAFKNNATIDQKSRLLEMVIVRRRQVGA